MLRGALCTTRVPVTTRVPPAGRVCPAETGRLLGPVAGRTAPEVWVLTVRTEPPGRLWAWFTVRTPCCGWVATVWRRAWDEEETWAWLP